MSLLDPTPDDAPAGTAFPQVAADDLPSTGLLSFYDRLRGRIADGVARRGGRFGPGVASALLLVPDVFVLLGRLSLDRDVPRPTRALLASALAYFLLPADLFPELLVGPGGYVDDLVLSLAVLAHAFGADLEPAAARHWSGSERLRVVVADVLGSARALVGASLYDRVAALLRRRGVDLDARPDAPR